MTPRILLGWGLGSFTSASLVGAVGLLHMRFMTDSLGLAMAAAGLLIVASKVYDAVLDPLMGALADRTTSRWGRFRPWLAGGGVLAAASLVMLFNVPAGLGPGGRICWSGVSLLVFSTAYTMFRIPYLALGRAVTRNFHERSRLMTFSVYGSALGTMAATSAAPVALAALGGGRAAHGLLALALAALVGAGALATFLLIDAEGEATSAAAREHAGFAKTVRAVLDNRPFLGLVLFKLTLFTGLALHGAAMPYYTRHVLGATDMSLGAIFLPQTLAMMASQPLWVIAARRIGRRPALMLAAAMQAAAMLGWLAVPSAAPTLWLPLLGGIEGLCIGGLMFGLYSVLGDTMDAVQARHEGVLAGVFVMIEKATSALGAFVFSLAMGWAGFVSASDAGSSQPASVVTGVIVAISVLPALAALLACLFLRAGSAPRSVPGPVRSMP
jgi:Na+/melibiose symporter-like transporter